MTSRPRVLGRYVVYDRIASGGMASVHFGRLQAGARFSRTVAIKELHPHEAGAQMYGRKAPARRVGFYFSRTSPSQATTAAWSLFDAAVKWASGM